MQRRKEAQREAQRKEAALLDDKEYGVLGGDGGDGDVLAVRSKRAVSFVGGYPVRNVQVIVRVYKSPAEVLLGFDVDSCAVGYDGRDVWATRRFRNAQNKSYNLVNPTRRSSNYEVRLHKYASRGYAVAVPGLDKARADPRLFSRNGARLLRTQGLARLLVYEFYDIHRELRPRVSYSPSLHRMLAAGAALDARTPPSFGFDPNNNNNNSSSGNGGGCWNVADNGCGCSADKLAEYAVAEADNPSDYSEVFIPWGPAWPIRATRKVLNLRDKAQLFSKLHETKEEDEKDGEDEEEDDDDDEKSEKEEEEDDDDDDDEKSEKSEEEDKSAVPLPHTHCLVTGIEGVISGKPDAYWCRLCRQHVPVEASSQNVTGPIQWERGCPCYQDYEHGVLRKLIVGSFTALTDPYDKDAYTSTPTPIPAGRPHPLQRPKKMMTAGQQQQQRSSLVGMSFSNSLCV